MLDLDAIEKRAKREGVHAADPALLRMDIMALVAYAREADAHAEDLRGQRDRWYGKASERAGVENERDAWRHVAIKLGQGLDIAFYTPEKLSRDVAQLVSVNPSREATSQAGDP